MKTIALELNYHSSCSVSLMQPSYHYYHSMCDHENNLVLMNKCSNLFEIRKDYKSVTMPLESSVS
jgi:hypothetical protein